MALEQNRGGELRLPPHQLLRRSFLGSLTSSCVVDPDCWQLGRWTETGRTKLHLRGAAILAAQTVANLRCDGTTLCISHLTQDLKGKTVEQRLAEKSEAEREEV